jgi:hypothetical protein
MKVLIEQIKPGVSPNTSQVYYTFWVRFMDVKTGLWITSGGWRYFPDTRTVYSPSVSKGNGSYVTTVKTSTELHNLIQSKLETLLADEVVEELPVAA